MAQIDFTKPIDNPELIALLCITRGRPEKLVQSVEAAAKKAADPANLDMWVYVDDDDAATRELIDSKWDQTIAFRINWLVLQRPRMLGEGFNELWRRSSNASLYMGFPDDYTVVTQNWDAEIRNTMCDKSANDLALGYLCDPLEPNSTVTIMVETAKWANFTGQFLIPYFPFWYGDVWLQQIADMLDRRYYIDVGMLPIDASNKKTQNMWDLYFWRRFFQILLLERIDTAQNMLDHIHPPNSPTREGAIRHMKHTIDKIESHVKRVPNKILNAIEARNSDETGPPSERYLEALQWAKNHLREMAPQIKKYNTARTLRSKIRLLTAEVVAINHDKIIS